MQRTQRLWLVLCMFVWKASPTPSSDTKATNQSQSAAAHFLKKELMYETILEMSHMLLWMLSVDFCSGFANAAMSLLFREQNITFGETKLYGLVIDLWKAKIVEAVQVEMIQRNPLHPTLWCEMGRNGGWPSWRHIVRVNDQEEGLGIRATSAEDTLQERTFVC